MSPRLTSRRRGLLLPTALATLAHLLALLALGWRIPTVAEKPQTDLVPPVEVALVRRPKPARPPIPAAARAAPPASAQPAPASPTEPPANPSPPVLTQPAPVAPPAEAAPDTGEQFRSALRGLVGCSDPEAYRLTRDERAICDQRLAAAKPAQVGPRYSAEEVAAFNTNKESIFTRKPHNECLPHIGNLPPASVTARVSSAATTAFGIACEWDFW